MADGQDWQSQNFRAKLVAKIDDAIRLAGTQMPKSSQEMEAHVFNKANSKEEYLALVARLILHLKDGPNSTQNRAHQMSMAGQGGPQNMGQMNQMPNRQIQDPINALATLTRPGQPNQQGMMPNPMMQHRPGMMTAAQMRFQQQMGMQQRPQLQRQDAFIVTSPQNINPVQSQPLPASAANLPFQGPPPQNVQRMNPMGMNPQQNQAPSPAQNVCSPAVLAAPSPSTVTPSPAYRNNTGVMSPGAALNTPGGNNPGSVGPAPSPRLTDEQMYMDKLQKLSKFVGPLRKMVDKLEKDESRRKDYEKMKNLLDILTDPSKRVPYETLERCEQVLENHHMSGKTLTPSQPVTTSSMFEHLYENVAGNIKFNTINHSLQKSFGPAISVFFGPPIKGPPLPSRKRKLEDDDKHELSNVLQGEIARLHGRFKISVDNLQHSSNSSVHLICKLENENFPSVPPITIKVPRSYPKTNPEIDSHSEGYDTVPFFQNIQKHLEQSLLKLPNQVSVSSLLNSWEMSIRRSCEA